MYHIGELLMCCSWHIKVVPNPEYSLPDQTVLICTTGPFSITAAAVGLLYSEVECNMLLQNLPADMT
jgi:hypothetical protein